MKKTILSLLLLSLLVLPHFVSAVTAVSWIDQVIGDGIIFPKQVNGTYPSIKVPYITGTSTTASRLAGGLDIGGTSSSDIFLGFAGYYDATGFPSNEFIQLGKDLDFSQATPHESIAFQNPAGNLGILSHVGSKMILDSNAFASTDDMAFMSSSLGIGTTTSAINGLTIAESAPVVSLFDTSEETTAALTNQGGLMQFTYTVPGVGSSFIFESDGDFINQFAKSYMVWGTNNTEKMRLTLPGNLGIGTTSPWAKLSVVGRVAGDFFDATSTAVAITDKTVTNVATASSTFSQASYPARTFAANTLQTGDQICFDLRGIYSTPIGAPSIVVRMVMGTGTATTTLASVTTTALGSGASNLSFDGDGCATVRATGASGSVQGDGKAIYESAAGTSVINFLRGTPQTIDTTKAQTADVTVQWDTNSSTRSVTVTQASMWVK